MSTRIIKALLKKDLKLFISDRFYSILTMVGLVFYIGMYFIMPATTDEKLNLAMYAPVMPAAFAQLTASDGAAVELFDTEEALKQSVEAGGYQAGVALPADILDIWEAGGQPTIRVYHNAAAPPEVSDAIITLVKELSYAQTGQVLTYETEEEILGTDLLGSPIPLRDRMRPLLAVFILLTETLSLASLIAIEIEQGTARAILTTPMRVMDLFLAKGILGVGLAMGQAVLFMALVGGFSQQPDAMLLTLFVGSLMVVGIGFLLASLTRDVMAVTGWGVLIMILLVIPGIGNIIPGLLSDWAKVIPSYYLTDTVSRITNYGAGIGDVWLNLVILAGFTVVVFGAGMLALRRRYL